MTNSEGRARPRIDSSTCFRANTLTYIKALMQPYEYLYRGFLHINLRLTIIERTDSPAVVVKGCSQIHSGKAGDHNEEPQDASLTKHLDS